MSRFENVHGLDCTAASAQAVAALDHTIEGYLAFARDTGDRLKAAFAADADMPLAHVLKGYFYHLMGLPALKRKVPAIAADAGKRMAGASARERLHLEALEAWTRGDMEAALAAWEAILSEHPRDALALRLAHHWYFYTGDSRNLRDVVGRSLWAWDEATPGYAHVLAMHAFGLEEAGDYAAAERTGREAVDLDPSESWGIHAVAHVMEMQDRRREGIDWITAHEPRWSTCHNFRFHLHWHRALMHLALGDGARTLELYDTTVWDAESSEYLDLCNDVALLLRLELAGIDVGERYRPIVARVRGQCDEPVLGFVDAHYVSALAAAGEPGEARALLARRAGGGGAFGAAGAGPISITLGEGLIAWRERRHADVVAAIAPLRPHIVRLGGSHAQRDVFDLLLTDAAMRCGRLTLARNLLSERLANRPGNHWGWARFAEVAEAMGDAIAAGRARDRSGCLETAA